MQDNKENFQSSLTELTLTELKYEFETALKNLNRDEEVYIDFFQGALRYFTYEDLCMMYIKNLITLTLKVYAPERENSKFDSNVINKIKENKRHLTAKQKKIVGELRELNPLILKNVLPHFFKKIEKYSDNELKSSKIIYQLMKVIQKENKDIYDNLSHWVSIKNIDWPDMLLPKRLLPKDLCALFNLVESTKKYHPQSYENFEEAISKNTLAGKDSQRKPYLTKIEAFYEKIVPFHLIELNETYRRSYHINGKDRNLISITEDMLKLYANKQNIDFYENSKKALLEGLYEQHFKNEKTIFGLEKIENNEEIKRNIQQKINVSLYEKYFEQFVDLVTKYKKESFKNSPIKGYLMYIDQINFLGKTRKEGDLLPTVKDSFHKNGLDENKSKLPDLITQETKYNLPIFFKQNWGDCRDQIFSTLFLNSNKVKHHYKVEVKELFNNFISKYSINKKCFFIALEQQIDALIKDKMLTKTTNKNDSSLYEMLRLLKSWSLYNQEQDIQNELSARVILRLLINVELDRDTECNIKQTIEHATKAEMSCLIQEFFSGYMVDNVLSGSQDIFNKMTIESWKEYQEENISSFSVLLMFLIEQGQYNFNDDFLGEFIDKKFVQFITHTNRPSRCSSFVFKRKKKIIEIYESKNEKGETEEVEVEVEEEDEINDEESDSSGYNRGVRLENPQKIRFINEQLLEGVDKNINEMFLSKYTDQAAKYTQNEKGEKVEVTIGTKEGYCCFEFNENTIQVLSDNHIEVKRFKKLVAPDRLKKIWDESFSIESSKIIAYSYRNYLFDSCFYQTSNITKSIFKNKIDKGNLLNHFSSIRKGSLEGYSFNYSHLFEKKLIEKNILLSQVKSLEYERFEIIKNIGQGSFGVVYKARDTLFDTEVAIKLIPHWFKNEDVSKQLVKEAAIMRSCQHPNIVLVYDLIKLKPVNFKPKYNNDVFDEDEFVYGIVMEHINGLTLNHFLDMKNDWQFGWPDELDYRQKLDLFIDICEGVKKIHELGIVHGDLKPENILIHRDENERLHAKIIDFGLSSADNESSQSSINYTFSSINVIEGGALTQQDDLYSLGMLFFYIFSTDYTGSSNPIKVESYFKGKSLIEVYHLKRDLYLSFISLKLNFTGFFDEDFYHLELCSQAFNKSSNMPEVLSGEDFISQPDPLAFYSVFKTPIYKLFSQGLDIKQTLKIVSMLLLPKVLPNIAQINLLIQNNVDQINLLIQKNAAYVGNSLNFIGLGQKIVNINNDIKNVTSLIGELIALKSDRSVSKINPFDTIMVPRFNGEILTLKQINRLPIISFNQLAKMVRHERDVKFLFDFQPQKTSDRSFIWLRDNTLYRVVSVGMDLFDSICDEAEELEQINNSYGQIFCLMYDIEHSQKAPLECLSIFLNIEKTVDCEYMSVFKDRKDNKQYSFPKILLETKVEIENEIERAFSIYSEVKKVFGSSIINYDGEPIVFYEKMVKSKLLSKVNAQLSQSIKNFLANTSIQNFNDFYVNCFDYSHLKKLIIKWKKKDISNVIDKYMELKFSCNVSPEYWLLMSYWKEKQPDKVTVLSR